MKIDFNFISVKWQNIFSGYDDEDLEKRYVGGYSRLMCGKPMAFRPAAL
jgi:hypothetical protein